MTRVALDAMGGDFAPKQIVVGAVEAACGVPDVKILLVGQMAAIQKEIESFSKDRKELFHEELEEKEEELKKLAEEEKARPARGEL